MSGRRVTKWIDTGRRFARFVDEPVRKVARRSFLRTGVPRVAARCAEGEAAILFFHRITRNDVGLWNEPVHSARVLERTLRMLTREYEIVALSELVRAVRGERPFPRRAVALTFDDGYQNNLANAAPLLARFGVPATVFVATGLIGTDGWMWAYELGEMMFRYSLPRFALATRDETVRAVIARSKTRYAAAVSCVEYFKDLPPDRRDAALVELRQELPVRLNDANRFLSWDEVRELARQGIEIGVHTVTHPILTQLPEHKVEWEMLHARTEIERELGARATLFSYPNGDTNPDVSAVAARHFEAAVTTSGALCDRSADPYELPRIFAPPDEQELEYLLARKFLGAPVRRLRRARTRNVAAAETSGQAPADTGERDAERTAAADPAGECRDV